MGGKGSGGYRPGAGAKPMQEPTGELPPEVAIPADLSDDERAAWVRLAPLARKKRTLMDETAEDFRQLCAAIVFVDKLQAKVIADDFETTKVTLQMDESGGGLQNVEKKKHHLLSELRDWRQFVSGRLASFRLSAQGRPIVAQTTEKPQTALEALRSQRPNGIVRVK
jgi:hypothetical protein